MKAWVNLGEAWRQESVAAHGHPDTRLPELEHQKHARHGKYRTHSHDSGHKIQTYLAEYKGQGVAHAQLLVAHHARKHQRNGHIQNGTNHHGIYHGLGQVALRVFTFFGGSRNRIKADIGKKYRANTLEHATQSIRGEWTPIFRIYIKSPHQNHHQNHQYLQHHQHIAHIARLLDTHIHQAGNEYYYHKGGQVYNQSKIAQHRSALPSRPYFFLLVGKTFYRSAFGEQGTDFFVTSGRREVVHTQVFGNMQPKTAHQPSEII